MRAHSQWWTGSQSCPEVIEIERVGGFGKSYYLVDLLLDHLHIAVSPTYPVEAISCDESRPEIK